MIRYMVGKRVLCKTELQFFFRIELNIIPGYLKYRQPSKGLNGISIGYNLLWQFPGSQTVRTYTRGSVGVV